MFEGVNSHGSLSSDSLDSLAVVHALRTLHRESLERVRLKLAGTLAECSHDGELSAGSGAGSSTGNDGRHSCDWVVRLLLGSTTVCVS